LGLRLKHILLVTCIFALAAGSFSILSLRREESIILEEENRRAALLAEIVRNTLVAAMKEGHGSDFTGFMRSLRAEEIIEVRLLRPDGTPAAASPAAAAEAAGPAFAFHLDIPNGPECTGCHNPALPVLGSLDVSLSQKNARERIENARERSLIAALATVVSLWASLALAYSVLIRGPLRQMEEALEKAGDVSPVAAGPRRGDELGTLTLKLEAMVSELAKSRRALQSGRTETMQNVEKMASIGELASAIAHEIKNPLAGISGAIQVFAEELTPGDPRKDIIMEILAEIGRLDKAVKNLLSFARPPEPHFVRTQVDGVLERCLLLMNPRAEKQNVRVAVERPDGPAEVSVDPEQMQQVFLNIMINALQSMPDGGSLTIRISALRERGRLEVAFIDSGQGIAEENLARIFKPFFTTKRSGTGLGLAISRNIVEKHGGDIVAESTRGGGATFRVVLPLEN